ncbi:MAG: DUF4276 family protein [Solirubrobacterales bacterium]
MIRIASIVEGHGEVEAVPILVRRLVTHFDPSCTADWIRPHRCPRSQLVADVSEMRDKAVARAIYDADSSGAVLVVLDSDDDCPVELSKAVAAKIEPACAARGVGFGIVVANREFEAWFLSAPNSIRGVRGIPEDAEFPSEPESVRGAKERLGKLMESGNYSPTVDQPRFSSAIDIEEARLSSRSFRRLCTEMERLAAELCPVPPGVAS